MTATFALRARFMANTNHRTWQKHRIGYFLASVHLDPIADGHSLEHDAQLANVTRQLVDMADSHRLPVTWAVSDPAYSAATSPDSALRRGSRAGDFGRRELARPYGRPHAVCPRVGPPRIAGSWCGNPCEDTCTPRRIRRAAHRPGGQAAHHGDLGSRLATRFRADNCLIAAGHSLRRMGAADQRMPAGGSRPVYSGRRGPTGGSGAGFVVPSSQLRRTTW